MEPVWLLFGTRAATVAWSIRLGFLGSWLFRCEALRSEGWISLDFLVRIEIYQWVARHEAGTILLPRSVPLAAPERWRGCPRFLACGKAGLFMGLSLTRFLIRCNRLSSEPLPSAPPAAGKRLARPRKQRASLELQDVSCRLDGHCGARVRRDCRHAGWSVLQARSRESAGIGNSARDGDHCALGSHRERPPCLELPAEQFRGQ